jgi:hypothetical protein
MRAFGGNEIGFQVSGYPTRTEEQQNFLGWFRFAQSFV